MIATGTIVDGAATYFGLAAAAIAVCGFGAHIKPALSRAGERRVREATLTGGIAGLALSVLVVVLSALVG